MLADMGRNRAHWDAVARGFAEDARLRDIDAAQLTAEERIRIALDMGAWGPETEATRRDLEQCSAAQAQLHVRWRTLQAKRADRS